MHIEIDIRTLYEFSGIPVPEEQPPLPQVEKMIREQFSFLPQSVEVQVKGWKGVITFAKETSDARAEAERLQKKAAQRASRY